MTLAEANQETAALLREHNPGVLTEAQALEAAAQIGGNTPGNKNGEVLLKISGKDFVMGLDLILKEVRPAAEAAA